MTARQLSCTILRVCVYKISATIHGQCPTMPNLKLKIGVFCSKYLVLHILVLKVGGYFKVTSCFLMVWEKSDEAQTSLMRLIIWLVKVTFPVIIHISHSVKQHLLQMDSLYSLSRASGGVSTWSRSSSRRRCRSEQAVRVCPQKL